MKQNNGYMIIVRLLAIGVSVGLWWASITFSVEGFNIQLFDLAWLGYLLAFSVTVAQLVFNKGVLNNPTLFGVGILAYIYGIMTNIIGILGAQNVSVRTVSQLTSSFDAVGFGIVLSFVIEIFPESLLLWALFPENNPMGDFVSAIMAGTKAKNYSKQPNRTFSRHKKPKTKRYKGAV